MDIRKASQSKPARPEERSTVSQQKELLRQFGIDPDRPDVQALVHQHGHTLYLALEGSTAPLEILNGKTAAVTVGTASRVSGLKKHWPLPAGFGELALALVRVAPVQSLPLLRVAIDWPMNPRTYAAVDEALANALEADAQRKFTTTMTHAAVTTTTATTTALTTGTQTAPVSAKAPGTLEIAMPPTDTSATDGSGEQSHTSSETSRTEISQSASEESAQAEALEKLNEEVKTMMWAAIKHDDPLKARAALMRAPLLNAPVFNGFSPLTQAAVWGQLKVVDYLLQHPDINPNLADKDGYTALHAALQGGRIDTVKRLLKEPSVRRYLPSSSGATPFFTAIEHGCLPGARLLLAEEQSLPLALRAHVIRATDDGLEPFHVTCRRGPLQTVQWLLAQPEILKPKGRDRTLVALLNLPTKAGDTPLLLAAGAGETEVVTFLLKHQGVQVNAVNRLGFTPLLRAIKSGHLETAKLLLASGATLDHRTNDGCGPLHLAAGSGNDKMVQWLLGLSEIRKVKGKRRSLAFVLNEAGPSGRTPLHFAVRSNFREKLVQLLLQQPDIRPNKADGDGITPLHDSAKALEVKAARLLLAHPSIEVNRLCKKGESAIFHVVRHCLDDRGSSLELAQLLVQHKAEINKLNNDRVTPLLQACLDDEPDMVGWLLDRPELLVRDGKALTMASVLNDTSLHTPLLHAAILNTPLMHESVGGDEAIYVLEILLDERGMDVNLMDASGHTPLHVVAKAGFKRKAALLLAHPDIQVDARRAGKPSGDTALHVAIQHGHVDVAEALVDTGADIDKLGSGGKTLLHLASLSGSADTAKWVLQQLAYPLPGGGLRDIPSLLNAAFDDEGSTPLHVAVAEGHTGTVELLLKQPGMDPNQRRRDQRASLHMAATQGLANLLGALLVHADPRTADGNGDTPLHMAAWAGACDCIELLLSCGIDLHRKNAQGDTALHRAVLPDRVDVDTVRHGAVKREAKEAVQLLLNRGADVYLTNHEGHTALHLAALHGHSDALGVLLAHPAIQGPQGQTRALSAVLNARDVSGDALLHLAALGEPKTLQLLLGVDGIDVNAVNAKGHAPLHIACANGAPEMAAGLLAHPSTNPALTGPYGYNALQIALVHHDMDFELFVDAFRDAMPRTAFRALIEMPNVWGVRLASIAAQLDMDDDAIKAVTSAPRAKVAGLPSSTNRRGWVLVGGQQSVVQRQEILQMGEKAGMQMQSHGDGDQDLTWQGLNSLPIARGDTVVCFFRVSMDLEIEGEMLTLGRNQKAPRTEVIRLLYEKGATRVLFVDRRDVIHLDDLDGDDGDFVWGPLSCRLNKDPYLVHPVPPEVGHPALDYTCVLGHEDVTQMLSNAAKWWLADLGKEPSADRELSRRSVLPRSTFSWNPKKEALKIKSFASASLSTLKQLSGAALDQARFERLLLQAVAPFSEAIGKLLKADPLLCKLQDHEGRTVLHHVCVLNKARAAAVLLEHGADPNVRSKSGRTAMQLAVDGGHSEVVALLQKHARKSPSS